MAIAGGVTVAIRGAAGAAGVDGAADGDDGVFIIAAAMVPGNYQGPQSNTNDKRSDNHRSLMDTIRKPLKPQQNAMNI